VYNGISLSGRPADRVATITIDVKKKTTTTSKRGLLEATSSCKKICDILQASMGNKN
jgi:hypothetical protein